MYKHFLKISGHLRTTLLNNVKTGCTPKNKSSLQCTRLSKQKFTKVIGREYQAVCALLHRSGLNHVAQLQACRGFHTSPRNDQQEPFKQGGPNGPNKPDNGDEDKDKISSLLAKAFLWMLTAYMVIAIISLMFPSSSQPEVSKICTMQQMENTLILRSLSFAYKGSIGIDILGSRLIGG
ncbi:hypothetical protein JTB14_025421 [Gonioctena quinquepunctata]|nr:hypothetical protein JTB14_025421 [Gonioctena quinquepunctata]